MVTRHQKPLQRHGAYLPARVAFQLAPGLLLTFMFMLWGLIAAKRWEGRFGGFARGYTRGEMMELAPRALPFLVLIVAIIYGFWNEIASPPEVAGIAAIVCILLVALLYGSWRPRALVAILRESTHESVAVLIVIAAAALFEFMLSRFAIPDAIAVAIADLQLPPIEMIGLVSVVLLIAALFLPPVAIILVLLPFILPLMLAAGFDPYWFAIVMTLNFQIALLLPPTGANLHVVRHLAPEIPATTIFKGTAPYILLIVLAIALLSVFPEIATWLPDRLMGPAP